VTLAFIRDNLLVVGLIDPLALVGVYNSRMDGRSSTACFLVMLVLFRSTTPAENCFIQRYLTVFCTKDECKLECLFHWNDKWIHEHWCDGKIFGKCNCNICPSG
uniref:Uncharacterized protein n=1 Tax=Aegilops tauschii subsp. strangulata TaxID=200361 RepID=A0A453M3F3_AEGTS